MAVASSQLALKPQDLIVALKLALNRDRDFVLADLADELGMALSSVHGAVKRAEFARLLSRATGSVRPLRPAILEFALHGARYAYPGQLGPMTRGIPTAIGGPVLRPHFEDSSESPVWPDPGGTVRGPGLQPLNPCALQASKNDAALYEVLTLIDALRVGAARERKIASEELERRLS
ncbi:hypothetical protein ACSFA3_15095 [Variovorax sp. RHLX14]|uniref:hypothetical protein n=1 Tax=Variovorax sp. RHLX14 TaxID=1259731 RepID=UPI003F453664